jgi:putative peptidoglycan lipid II flippase
MASLTARSLSGALGVLLSRLSGILRSVVLSASFGAGLVLDSFFIALRLPSSLRDLLADGALSSATTTVLTAHKADQDRLSVVLAQILWSFFLITFVIASAGAIWSADIVRGLADATFPEEGVRGAAAALRWMAFYLPVAMFCAVCMSALSIQGRLFGATAASGFFNIGIIGGALVLAPGAERLGHPPAVGIALGTLLGGVAQCFVMARPLIRQRLLTRASLAQALTSEPFWRSTDVGVVLRLIVPRTVGQGALILGMVATTHFATAAGPGSVTLLTNTLILILVPVGLFGVAGGYAALPLLAEARQRGDMSAFWSTLREGMSLVTVLAALAISGLTLLSVPVLQLLFEHGQFTRADVLRNAETLCAFAFSIWFTTQNRLVTQALYALDRTRQVAFNAVIYVLVLLVLLVEVTPYFGLMGMGLAAVSAAGVEWGLNLLLLARVPTGVSDLDPVHGGAQRTQRLLGWPHAATFLASGLSVAGGMALTQLTGARTYWLAPDFGRSEAIVLSLGGGFVLILLWSVLMWWRGPEPLRRQLKRLTARVWCSLNRMVRF